MINILRILFTLGICLVFPVSLPAVEKGDIPVFRLGTASEDGAYYSFADELIANLNKQKVTSFRLTNVVTQGSVDNLMRIKKQELDLAIVQNNIAYYVYEGRHGYPSFQGFSALFPLFTEYIQVLVRRDSNIRILGDLKNKTISLGSQRSGSYHNALDLMREIGLRSGIEFEARHLPVEEAIDRLFSGDVDAVVYTGALLPVKGSSRLQDIRIIPISREITVSLKARSSYYSFAEMRIPTSTGFKMMPTIAVQAYLVAGNHLSAGQVQGVVEAIASIWPQLTANSRYQLGTFKGIVRRSPVPVHAGMKRFLRKAGYLETDYYSYLGLAFVLMLAVGVVVWAHRTTSGYDRLGNIRVGEGEWYYRVAVYIARTGTFIIITAVFIAITVTLVFTIRYFEMDYARQMNIDNEFADVDFSDALLWMFMFMGAGEPGDIFPLSTPGKILATILPFLGITSMLGLFFMAVERRRQLSAKRKRGTVTQDMRNHVLVCGWNEKVPGLVWALTNKEAPERKKVVIVAALEGDMPLEHYNFDPGLVSYCCGDSADHGVLDRAHIGKAEAAIVVAGLQKRKGRNIRSVLSVMALKEAHKKARAFNGVGDSGFFVAAEMIYDENQALFEASQVDAVVHSEKIADRMAALCCTSSSVVDFVLDMFTYDEHAELYSIRVDSLQSRHLTTFCAKWFKWRSVRKVLLGGMAKKANDHGDKPALVGMRLADARNIFASNGVNVVGLVKASYNCTPNLVDHEFNEISPYNLLLGTDDGDLRIENGDSLLYIADDYDDIYTAMLPWHGARQELLRCLEVDGLWPPGDKRVLLAGDLERCLQVRRLLKDASWVNTRILIEDSEFGEQAEVYSGKFFKQESWEQAGLADMDVVLVLGNSNVVTQQANLITDQGEVDARAIFAARFARKFFEELAPEKSPDALQVIAEMAGRNSRPLFKDAGVDVVIPSSLLVERILTKLVYSRGLVCNYLMALLAFEDNVYLYSLNLEQDHHELLLDKTFGQLMEEMPEGWQIMGILPGKGNGAQKKWRENLINKKEDFDHHFIAHPEANQQEEYKTRVGDELVVIVDRRNRFRD